METVQILFAIVVVSFAFYGVYSLCINIWFEDGFSDGGIVPGAVNDSIPALQPWTASDKYAIVKTTIDTLYGQDIKETAVKIFLSSDTTVNFSVEKAKELIDEVCMVCSKIDHERNAELKAFAKMSELGIKP